MWYIDWSTGDLVKVIIKSWRISFSDLASISFQIYHLQLFTLNMSNIYMCVSVSYVLNDLMNEL